MSTGVLANTKVVLVEPTHPGNVGAAARAMKTMGLTRLCIVNGVQHLCAEATARASGADDVLYAAQTFATLEQALADCVLVVGASARTREIPWPELNPRECAQVLARQAEAATCALVFGREHSGLSNAELDRCHYLARIPANRAFSSLNLAAAVQLLAYEVRMALNAPVESSLVVMRDSPPATAEEVEGLMAHCERVMVEVGFFDPEQPKRLRRRLRRLFNRASLERTEVNVLRGFLKAVQQRVAGKG